MSTIISLGWVNLSITWLFSTCSYRIKISTRFWLNRDEISARFTVIKFWYVMVILFLHCYHLSCETESHYGLRIHWRLSTILKTSNKSGWSNAFWYVKVYIFWKFIQYTIHWDKIKMLKKFLLDKINVTKNALFFLSRAQTHHSFAYNSRFLCELKHKARLSKTVCGIFHFSFRLVFIKRTLTQIWKSPYIFNFI